MAKPPKSKTKQQIYDDYVAKGAEVRALRKVLAKTDVGRAQEMLEWCIKHEIHVMAIDVGDVKLGFAVPPGQPLGTKLPPGYAEDVAEREAKRPTSYLGAYAQQEPPPEPLAPYED